MIIFSVKYAERRGEIGHGKFRRGGPLITLPIPEEAKEKEIRIKVGQGGLRFEN